MRLSRWALLAPLLLGGCSWWSWLFPPPMRLTDWKVRRLAVVPFADATYQQQGKPMAEAFARVLGGAAHFPAACTVAVESV